MMAPEDVARLRRGISGPGMRGLEALGFENVVLGRARLAILEENLVRGIFANHRELHAREARLADALSLAETATALLPAGHTER